LRRHADPHRRGRRTHRRPAHERQPKTPADAYDNAYAQLTRAHYNVHRNLEARGQNQYGAQEAMALIVRCLRFMKACVPVDDRARFDPYLERYAGWKTDIEKGTWGGAFLTISSGPSAR